MAVAAELHRASLLIRIGNRNGTVYNISDSIIPLRNSDVNPDPRGFSREFQKAKYVFSYLLFRLNRNIVAHGFFLPNRRNGFGQNQAAGFGDNFKIGLFCEHNFPVHIQRNRPIRLDRNRAAGAELTKIIMNMGAGAILLEQSENMKTRNAGNDRKIQLTVKGIGRGVG